MKLHGPGKYDNQCERVMVDTDAVGVFLVVVSGALGNGVSLKTADPELMHVMPGLLEAIAAQMRRDAQQDADA